jgi:hypothetical protein
VEGLEMTRLAMPLPSPTPAFWAGKRVLLTGHTGFKGAWMAYWLSQMGAEVTGFALPPDDAKALYLTAGIEAICHSEIGDLRDRAAIGAVAARCRSLIRWRRFPPTLWAPPTCSMRCATATA